MSSQEEILDSEGITTKKSKKKTKSYYQNRAIIYVVCMFGGGLIFFTFLSEPSFNILLDAFLYTASSILTATLLETFRKYRRERKNKKKGIEVEDDPLWFHIIESALSLMILLLILSLLASR
ncbi:MAG: hypothetical protein ACI857_001657 [Arenicella sp.]|jgi:hypothetical protein